MDKIKVLVVDDSALVRKMLSHILAEDERIEVVGVANDPLIARDKIKQLKPDVLTLDVEMPRMNGMQFLGNLMRLHPMPVVMVSTLTKAGAAVTLEALEMGAIDYIAKPRADDERALQMFARELVSKVRMAAQARVRPLRERHQVRFQSSLGHEAEDVRAVRYRRWILVGSSTGGTEAIKELLSGVTSDCPPILITQHIPGVFSSSFAQRLNHCLAPEVVEARNGLEVTSGRVIIAQGDHHLTFRQAENGVHCVLSGAAPVNRHKPSVEMMFDAITAVRSASDLVAVMLTGMGNDGAEAMKRLHMSGARTLAQDESTSVVWGMPGAAVQAGAVDRVVPLHHLAREMLKLAQ